MEEKFGPIPRAPEGCPLCRVGGNTPHKSNCPWQLWALGERNG